MKAGTRVGAYELVRPLGSGGMGEVWEAVLHGPDGYRKSVALKLLREGPIDPDARQAMMNEARLGALLHHPNVVSVGAMGEIDGRWHLAMELVVGASVAELAASGPLPPRLVLEIGIQTCAGLAHIHALSIDGRPAGLVHRDIKAQNLLVDRSGLVKVADLGVAGTAEATGVATAGYTAPEQLDRRPESRSDLFSLGVVLYLLATGVRPFGRGPEALHAVRASEARLAEPGFLALVDQAVPGLGVVVGRCLRADPADRWSSPQELGTALGALRSHQRVGPTLLERLAAVRPELGVAEATTASVGATVGLPRGNLSPSRDRFFGRAPEIAHLGGLIRGGERLIVLVGPGGMGKTRLARQAVAELPAEPAGGAWFFDLSEARSPDEICLAVSTALGLALGQSDPVAQLGHALGARGAAVLILDNLEQCVDHLEETVGRWLSLAPEAVWVCTSRVSLRLPGDPVSVGPLTADDGVALFLDRSPVGVPTSDRSEVRSLVETLEGFPLAIELAAARTRLLPVSEIRRRLTVDLRVLGGGGEERPERHRSVEGSLRWSWDLLSESAKAAIAQLSVFDGGFGLSAAAAVLAVDRSALEVLRELVEASLVRVDPDDARFSMLVVVQQFASRKLTGADRVGAEVRHGAYFAQFGSRDALAALSGRTGTERMWLLVSELENIVGACRRAVTREDAPTATAAVAAAWEVYVTRGPFTAGISLLEAVDGMTSLSPIERGQVELAHAQALLSVGRSTEAIARYESAYARFQTQGDRGWIARSQRGLARAQLRVGRREEGRALLEAARAATEGLDWPGESGLLTQLGMLHLEEGRMGEAGEYLRSALRIAREAGHRRQEGTVLLDLGLLHSNQGRVEEALSAYRSAIAALREVGDRRAEAIVLGNLGAVCMDTGRPEEAADWCRAAIAIHREVGNRAMEGVSLSNLGGVAAARGQLELGAATYNEALALLREVRNRFFEACALHGLGDIHHLAGRRNEARLAYETALVVHREAGHRRGAAYTLGQLSDLFAVGGQIDEARRCLGQALTEAREAGAARQEGYLLLYSGRIHSDCDELEAANARTHEGLALLTKVDDGVGVGVGLRDLGDRALRIGDFSGAEDRLSAAVVRVEKRHVPWWAESLAALGEALAARDPIAGGLHLDEAIAAARSGGWHPILASSLCRRARALGDRRSLREAESMATGEDERSRLGRDLLRTRSMLEARGE